MSVPFALSRDTPSTSSILGEEVYSMESTQIHSCKDGPTTAGFTTVIAREAILMYLHRTQITARFGSDYNDLKPDVETKVREVILTWNLGISLDILEMRIQCAVMVGAFSYQHAPLQLRIAVALFCFCMVCFDDDLGGADARREFVTRYHLRQPQLHPVYDRMIDVTLALRELVPLYCGNLLVSQLLEACNEEVFHVDEAYIASCQNLKLEAHQYVEYVRMIDGIPAPFVVAIWPQSLFPDIKEYIQALPDAFDWTNIINDLLSFYKEAAAGERENFVYRYALVHGKSLKQTLEDIVDRLIMRDETVRAILGEGRAKDAWDSFTAGFVQFHFTTPRYRLNEVISDFR